MVLCWIIVAIRKHVVPKESLTSGGERVRVQEPLDDRVIVAGLEVIPSSVICVVVSSESALHEKTAGKVGSLSVFRPPLLIAGNTIQGLLHAKCSFGELPINGANRMVEWYYLRLSVFPERVKALPGMVLSGSVRRLL